LKRRRRRRRRRCATEYLQLFIQNGISWTAVDL
jgi:hypothetical protein